MKYLDMKNLNILIFWSTAHLEEQFASDGDHLKVVFNISGMPSLPKPVLKNLEALKSEIL